MVDIQSVAAEIRRGIKKRKIEDRNYRAKIQWPPITLGDHKKPGNPILVINLEHLNHIVSD